MDKWKWGRPDYGDSSGAEWVGDEGSWGRRPKLLTIAPPGQV